MRHQLKLVWATSDNQVFETEDQAQKHEDFLLICEVLRSSPVHIPAEFSKILARHLQKHMQMSLLLDSKQVTEAVDKEEELHV